MQKENSPDSQEPAFYPFRIPIPNSCITQSTETKYIPVVYTLKRASEIPPNERQQQPEISAADNSQTCTEFENGNSAKFLGTMKQSLNSVENQESIKWTESPSC